MSRHPARREGELADQGEAGTVVVALGGNALLSPDRAGRGRSVERERLAEAADAVSALARGRRLVVTHGNGPQVGLLALREGSEVDEGEPLDVLGAETEGMIGYPIERELRARLPGRSVVTLLTQVEVARDDPAFADPEKPIGPFYGWASAERLRDERGWRFVESDRGWRRVVPSPRPLRVLEIEAVKLLLEHDHVVICGGGGGIPVTVEPGRIEGVDGVIDKDRSAALLAAGVSADVLILLTDEAAVYRDWPERSDPIRWASVEELRALDLPRGSMGPKVEAATSFVERTGGRAAIGRLPDAVAVLLGRAGTQITG